MILISEQAMFNNVLSIRGIALPETHARLVIPLGLLAIFALDGGVRALLLGALADAYVNVGVFVAATLYVYYALERRFGFDITTLEQAHPAKMLSISAFLGALPGCGGAIIVVSQYAAGHLPFAAVVTVLVATMGDAAFLLLAKAPMTGLLVISTGLIVGILSGAVIWLTHPPEFLSHAPNTEQSEDNCLCLQPIPAPQLFLWTALLIATLPLTLASAFQMDIPAIELFGHSIELPLVLGASAAILGILMWAFLPLQDSYKSLVAEDSVAQQEDLTNIKEAIPTASQGVMQQVIHDTNFIMVWVALAFAAFELTVHYTGLSLQGLFVGAGALAPLIGILIGFLPGCGPQIIVATLYLQGIAPLSTLLGNAISNDGDALFPAIALTPKAAVLATWNSPTI
ncbi:MAG: hypothetical protein CSA53_00310 [Gammaproteobacteria bacterium]|nr:MAG: hypothetical protein CSA53_00310 [Gammaproteobacteria bacterium]